MIRFEILAHAALLVAFLAALPPPSDAAGVPAFLFRQSGRHDYSRAHHTDADRFEDLDAESLRHSSLVIALTARAVANLDALLPREATSR